VLSKGVQMKKGVSIICCLWCDREEEKIEEERKNQYQYIRKASRSSRAEWEGKEGRNVEKKKERRIAVSI
jgi:hypothetical protein